MDQKKPFPWGDLAPLVGAALGVIGVQFSAFWAIVGLVVGSVGVLVAWFWMRGRK